MKDLAGQKFGLLKVLEKTDKRACGSVVWKCICDCGNTTEVSSGNLHSRHTTSCGCHKKKTSSNICTKLFTKHGHGKSSGISKTYNTWLHMLNRCSNPKNEAYKNYGGRGISVCERWNDYANFLEDMGERPSGTSIDRIDVNGNYEPNNCRWATNKEQHNNKRSNHEINYNGETLTITQLANKYGVNRANLFYRLKSGWEIEKALNKK